MKACLYKARGLRWSSSFCVHLDENLQHGVEWSRLGNGEGSELEWRVKWRGKRVGERSAMFTINGHSITNISAVTVVLVATVLGF